VMDWAGLVLGSSCLAGSSTSSHVLEWWLGHDSLGLGLDKRFYPSGRVVQKLVSNVPTILINNIHWLQKEYFNFALRLSKIKDFLRSTELYFYKI
jgi:hypothetical protein